MSTLAPTFMERVDSLIQQNISDNAFSTYQLAELLYLSSSQVYRKIKQKTDCSPSIYIRNKRLEKSLDLIQQSDSPLLEIAHQVGFSSLSYFSRSFSNYYGYPPSQSRKKYQLNKAQSAIRNSPKEIPNK